MNNDVFKSLGVRVAQDSFETVQHPPFGSDEFWEWFVRSRSVTIYHPAGTCKVNCCRHRGQIQITMDETYTYVHRQIDR